MFKGDFRTKRSNIQFDIIGIFLLTVNLATKLTFIKHVNILLEILREIKRKVTEHEKDGEVYVGADHGLFGKGVE